MVEFGTSSAFRGWVRVRVLGYGFVVRGRKVKSRDCALASDLVRAQILQLAEIVCFVVFSIQHVQFGSLQDVHESGLGPGHDTLLI